MEYNYNSWAGIPPNPALYPNPSSLTMTDPDQFVPQNPNPSLFFGYGHINGATSSVEATPVYYQDPNVVRLLGSNGPFRVGEVAAVSLNGAENLTPANVNSNFLFQPPTRGSWGGGQRTIKIQPVWCDVCKLEFNSKTVFDQHILGKRHQKSLDKLKGGSVIATPASVPLVASSASENPFVGLQEKAVKVVENLETKKRKVLEGGAATDEVRICLPCNVVCNSERVFQNHLIGKKHIAKITKQQKSVAASASLVPSEMSVNSFIGPQEKPDIANSGNVQDAMKKEAERIVKLETKTQKVLEGGAATDEVRKCLVCKVVCNSETVFSHHLAGKKHIANMKKHAAGVAPAS